MTELDPDHQIRNAGSDNVPDTRLGGQGEPVPVDRCRECGVELGAGYLCDDCDRVEVLEP